MNIALIIFGIIAVVGGIIAIAMYLEKKRAEAMKSVAATMNFTFAEKPDKALRERLSHFHLFSQGHAKKIQVFGLQDIDFDTHPDFSKRYLLKGDDESEIRKLFRLDTLSFYESHGKLSTEAAGHQLIHYHANRRVPPEKLSEFIREGVGY